MRLIEMLSLGELVTFSISARLSYPYSSMTSITPELALLTTGVRGQLGKGPFESSHNNKHVGKDRMEHQISRVE